jgi:hypothetical protein
MKTFTIGWYAIISKTMRARWKLKIMILNIIKF